MQQMWNQAAVVSMLTLCSAEDIKKKQIRLNPVLLFGILGIFFHMLWRIQSIENILLGMSVGVVLLMLSMLTGSGCILLSILKNAPTVRGTGSDVSKQALLVAKENAKLHDLEAEWVRGNLFDNVSGSYDVIVSNPPYIAQAEIPRLMPEVAQFEPIQALDGGVDGLDFYRKITEEAPQYLKENGYLFFEIGYDQGQEVQRLMCEAGFTDVAVIKDLAGNDRVVKGQLK